MSDMTYFERPVLVTGAPRSGTSMVTGVLEACGLWLGPTLSGDANNPKGYFENLILRDKVQKDILLRSGFDRLGIEPLPPAGWRPNVPNLKAVVRTIVTAQGYDDVRPWGFKDAKLTLNWRLWHAHFPQAKWVVVRRSTDAIVASCLRADFMKQHSADPAFWRAFVRSYQARLDRLRATVPWSRAVDSAQLVAGDLALERLIGELGLAWREDAVRRFVTRELWHAPAAGGSHP